MLLESRLALSGAEYKDRLTTAIEGAEERVLLETMTFDCLGDMEAIVESCICARKRGAEVLLIYDRYTYLNLAFDKGPKAAKDLRRQVERLEAKGIKTQKVGGIEPNPFAGRHHVKAVVADDTVFMAGGINLSGASFEARDYMIEFNDHLMADRLFEALPRIAAERPESEVIPVDEDSRVVIDGGVKGVSAILEVAIDIAERAEKLWYVSKLSPDGELLGILKEKPADYWFNSFSSAGGMDKLAIMIDRLKTDVENLYKDNTNLHAKFIVGQMPGGNYEAIAGSHNFNSRGVSFGTQELALHTKSQSICRQLIDFTGTL